MNVLKDAQRRCDALTRKSDRLGEVARRQAEKIAARIAREATRECARMERHAKRIEAEAQRREAARKKAAAKKAATAKKKAAAKSKAKVSAKPKSKAASPKRVTSPAAPKRSKGREVEADGERVQASSPQAAPTTRPEAPRVQAVTVAPEPGTRPSATYHPASAGYAWDTILAMLVGLPNSSLYYLSPGFSSSPAGTATLGYRHNHKHEEHAAALDAAAARLREYGLRVRRQPEFVHIYPSKDDKVTSKKRTGKKRTKAARAPLERAGWSLSEHEPSGRVELRRRDARPATPLEARLLEGRGFSFDGKEQSWQREGSKANKMAWAIGRALLVDLDRLAQQASPAASKPAEPSAPAAPRKPRAAKQRSTAPTNSKDREACRQAVLAALPGTEGQLTTRLRPQFSAADVRSALGDLRVANAIRTSGYSAGHPILARAEPEPPVPPPSVGRSDYEQRREARIERLQRRAAQHKQAAEQAFARVDSITAHIPLGQPILVGHHSERRARKDQERIRQGMHRGVQEQKTAEKLTRRAEAAEQNQAISADDPEALRRLDEKIAELEQRHARAKAINAQARKEGKELPVPGYVFSNSSAEIRRLKKRKEKLVVEAQKVRDPIELGEWVLRDNKDINRIQIQNERGRRSTAEEIKLFRSNGFVFSRTEEAWQRKPSNAAWWAGERVLKALAETSNT